MDFLVLKEKGGNAFPHFRLTYICAIRRSTIDGGALFNG